MFESSLSGAPARGGPGAMSLAVAAHFLVLLPIAAISLLVVDEVELPRNPADVVIFRVSLPAPEAGVQLPPSRGAGGEARRGESARAAPPGPPAQPPAEPKELSRDLDSWVEPYGTAPGPGSGEGDGPAGSPFGSPDGFGTDVKGVESGPGEGGGAPSPVGPDVDPPRLLLKVMPDYPPLARVARISGKVFVKAVISPAGDVVEAEIVSSRSVLLNEAALLAVRQWKYRPARRNGEPVAVYFTVTVDFILQ